MEPEVSVRGLLTAVDWYEDGTTRRVALLTPDEQEYEVEPEDICRRLVRHVRAEVVLRGFIRAEGGRTAVRVTSFRLLSDES